MNTKIQQIILDKNKSKILKMLLKMNIDILKTLRVIILIYLGMNEMVVNESYKNYKFIKNCKYQIINTCQFE